MDERKTNVEKSGMDGRSGVFDDVPLQANGGSTEQRSWTNAKPTSRSQAWMAVRVFSTTYRNRRMEAPRRSVHGRTQNQRREVRHGWPFGCFRSRSAAGEWRLNQAAFMDERT